MKNLFKIIFTFVFLMSIESKAQIGGCAFTLEPDSSCITLGNFWDKPDGSEDSLFWVGSGRAWRPTSSYFRIMTYSFKVDKWKIKFTGTNTKLAQVVVDTTTGETFSIPLKSSSPVNVSAYSAGTIYSLTTTSQKMTFGTTSPSITLPSSGTYIIYSNLTIGYSGLTNAAINTCNFKLRRTNNTATDLSNTNSSFDVPIVTLLTTTAGDADINTIIYTTNTSGDVIEMWGNRTGGITLGSINVNQAYILAVKQ